MESPNRVKNVYSICPYIAYNNDQILKDCCIIPYMFQKLLGYKTVIVSAQRAPWTNLAYIPDLTIDILPTPDSKNFDSDSEWAKMSREYIKKNYRSIDILFCFGSYPNNIEIVPLYKKLRPDGKVLLKLDANKHWLDSIDFEKWDALYSNCDVITCESKKMKKLLSRKWPYKIDYVPNGTFDYIAHERASYLKKENIILTVGRIGLWEKATEVLLDGFRLAEDKIPDWNLRLVGGFQNGFQKKADEFFEKNPHLRTRVQFVGRIDDKHQLEQEYQRAKIFAITSRVEGGTPNVCAEALKNGCYMVCSSIDGAAEATGFGKCGKEFPIDNPVQLSHIFKEICNDEKYFARGCYDAQDIHDKFFKYNRTVYKLNHLLHLNDRENINE